MAIETMLRIRMAAHKTISDELLGKIQRLGCCQFIPQNREKIDERDAASIRGRLRHVEDLLGEARFVMRFLDPYVSDKGSGLSRAMGDLPSYSMEELAKYAGEDKFTATVALLRDFEKKSSDAKSGISRVNGLKAQILPLLELPYSLDFYTKGTDAVQGVLYSIATGQAGKFEAEVGSMLGDMAEVHALRAREGDSSRVYSLIYARSRADDLQEVLAEFQLTRVDVPPQLSGAPPDELGRLERELQGYREADDAITAEIKAMADSAYKSCQYRTDYWNILRAKLNALLDGEQTEQIIVSSFWIPQNCMEALRKTAEPYEDLTEIAEAGTDAGNDIKPPTLLRNSKFSRAIEPLITMYGTPTYGGFDPTDVVTPFFYLFFGMCFGDAGYGLVIAGLLLLLMMKRRITGTLKKFLVLLTVGNIMAVVVGALTFSWFGDSITSFSFLKPLSGLQSMQILDPMNDPMTFLYISLTLGFIQIMTGLVIAMMGNLKSGDRMAAFSDQGGWIIFLCGLVLLGLSSAGVIGLSSGASGMIAAAGAVILVATQGREKQSVAGKLFSGVMSLYNVTGYLGDVLSYSRLLALGLGSAAVGMVINLLANLVSGVPYIGVLLGILIFVLGHVFSIAVNILGAFVHSLRLQYVEFFGKFYDASGEDFAPLSMSTQYVKLSD
jgi:V/A-type H+-transporting ATPase subunit I